MLDEPTIKKALEEEQKLKETIKKSIESGEYRVDEIINEIKTNESVVYKVFGKKFKSTRSVKLDNFKTLGEAKKVEAVLNKAIDAIKEKNPNLADSTLKVMAGDLVDYLQEDLITKGKNKYDLIVNSLKDEEVREALQTDKAISEKLTEFITEEANQMSLTKYSKTNGKTYTDASIETATAFGNLIIQGSYFVVKAGASALLVTQKVLSYVPM